MSNIIYYGVIILTIGSVIGIVWLVINESKENQKQKKLMIGLAAELEKKEEVINLLENEIQRLHRQIELMEEYEKDKIPKTIKSSNLEYTFKRKFKGKVLVGNYVTYFALQTREMLRAFGLSVDIVEEGQAVIDRIKSGQQYDLIITNNTYKDGVSGYDIVSELNKIKDFNTPIVVNTIEHGQRTYFLNNYGYDEYLEKPIEPKELEKVLEKFLVETKQKTKKTNKKS